MIAESPIIEIFKTPPPEGKGWVFIYEGDMSIHSLRVLARTYANLGLAIYVQALGKLPTETLEYFASKVFACRVRPI